MKLWSPRYLVMSAFFLIFLILGLRVSLMQYANREVAISALIIVVAISTAIFSIKVFFSVKARNRFIYRLALLTSLGFDLFWLMLSSTLLVYVTNSLSLQTKIIYGIFSFTVVFHQIKRAIAAFESSLDKKKEFDLRRMLERQEGLEDWRKIDNINKWEAQLYFPAYLKKIDWLVYFLMAVSMLCGLAFRKTFPAASLMAWSIPAVIIGSLFAGMICRRAKQIAKIRTIEMETGRLIP